MIPTFWALFKLSGYFNYILMNDLKKCFFVYLPYVTYLKLEPILYMYNLIDLGPLGAFCYFLAFTHFKCIP